MEKTKFGDEGRIFFLIGWHPRTERHGTKTKTTQLRLKDWKEI